MRRIEQIAGARRVWTIDYSIYDHSVDGYLIKDAAQNAGLWVPGGKVPLAPNVVVQMKRALSSLEKGQVESFPGGSMANLYVQLGKTVKGRGVELHKVTVVGGDGAKEIMEDYQAAGIRLIPGEEHLSRIGIAPKSALSFVVRMDKGERCIGTDPSNLDLFVDAAFILRSLRETQPDLIILPGSMRQKLGIEIFDAILTYAWENNIPVVAPLPTNAFFSSQNHEYFRFIMPSMVVLSNIEELCAVYKINLPSDEKFSEEQKKDVAFMAAYEAERESKEIEAFQRLAYELREGRKNLKIHHGRDYTPVAMITRGKKGVGIIVAEGEDISKMITYVPQQVIDIKGSTLGAGDCTYFLAVLALMIGMDVVKDPGSVGELMMFGVREKLELDHKGGRIPKPLETLGSKRPGLVRALDRMYPQIEVATRA